MSDVRVFSLVASSAALEHNFSTFAFIHSKLRKKLTQENVIKLVYVTTNNYCFNEFKVQDDEDDYEEQVFNFQQLLNETDQIYILFFYI